MGSNHLLKNCFRSVPTGNRTQGLWFNVSALELPDWDTQNFYPTHAGLQGRREAINIGGGGGGRHVLTNIS
jgi:hypothetical protein